MKKIIAGMLFCLVSPFALAQLPPPPTCTLPDSKCWLQGAFLAGAPTSPTMTISVGTTAPWWIGVVPWTWYEQGYAFEYASAVHLTVSGFAGVVLVRNGRFAYPTLEVTDIPNPPVLYQTTWNAGTGTITSLDALVPLAWVQSVTTTVINGVTYKYNTWTYDGPLDAHLASNLEPQIFFALESSCQAIAGLGHCSYSGYQYANLVSLPPSGDE